MELSKIIMFSLPPPDMYHSYDNRLDSMSTTFLTKDYQKNLAKFGIYYERGNGAYQCAFCELYMLKLNMRTLKYHTYSTCPMATKIMRDNIVMRRESFNKFKIARNVYSKLADELSENGFYYYGCKFKIRCAECLLTIVKLNKTDAIELVHARYSPDCIFNNKPSAPSLDNMNDKYSHTNQNNNKVTAVGRLYPLLSDPLTVDDKSSEKVLQQNDTMQKITLDDDGVKHKTDTNEDDYKLCKICFEKEKNTCVLPCKHVSTCMDCAKKCKTCCICRVKVKERLEIYLQ